MLLLGCKPSGRNTEQHDIFFSIGTSLSSLVPSLQQFWPEAGNTLHIDAYREVTHVDGYSVRVQRKGAGPEGARLFLSTWVGTRPMSLKNFITRFSPRVLISLRLFREPKRLPSISTTIPHTWTTNTGLTWTIFLRSMIYYQRM